MKNEIDLNCDTRIFGILLFRSPVVQNWTRRDTTKAEDPSFLRGKNSWIFFKARRRSFNAQNKYYSDRTVSIKISVRGSELDYNTDDVFPSSLLQCVKSNIIPLSKSTPRVLCTYIYIFALWSTPVTCIVCLVALGEMQRETPDSPPSRRVNNRSRDIIETVHCNIDPRWPRLIAHFNFARISREILQTRKWISVQDEIACARRTKPSFNCVSSAATVSSLSMCDERQV